MRRCACGFRPSTSYARRRKAFPPASFKRTLGVAMNTAWFMGHRIDMPWDPGSTGPMGGPGKTVEADETYIGKSRHTKRKMGVAGP